MTNVKTTLLAVATGVAMSVTAAQAEITIATAGPMTGQYSPRSAIRWLAAQALAIQDLNAAGGVLGEVKSH